MRDHSEGLLPTFGSNSHLILGVVLEESLDTTAWELISGLSALFGVQDTRMIAKQGYDKDAQSERDDRRQKIMVQAPSLRSFSKWRNRFQFRYHFEDASSNGEELASWLSDRADRMIEMPLVRK